MTGLLRAIPAARRPFILAAAVVSILPFPAFPQHLEHHPPGTAEIGRVEFPTSCASAVSEDFEKAVAMLHSFWFTESAAAFRAIADRDPGCGMAHWGIAMTEMGNPMARTLPAPEALEAGLRAAETARELTASATPREQRYAAGVVAYFGGGVRPHEARMTDHENAMAALRLAHPEDLEAAIFHARAIVANAPPTDLTFARQLAGAALMLPLFEANPEHPGLAHYIIHAYDAPALADQGVRAAKAYAAIAPAAPHALHMPSHIFTRLGYWNESIETNRRSAEAEPVPDAAVHPMDYMVYAFLQLGRDDAAREVVERAILNPDRFYGGTLGYNFAAMPARFALERNDWVGAASLRIPTGALSYVEALTRFARAIGLARSGGDATPEIAALALLEDSLRRQNDAYWTTIVRAQRLAAQSWAAQAQGDAGRALALGLEAAELEETVEKHPITPGPLLPARELLGDLLLELDRPRDALAAYEATLEREPNRARTLFGAARAAELADERERAHELYTELLELMAEADAARPEPAAARRYLTNQADPRR